MMPGMPMNAPPGVYTPTNGIINVTMFICPYCSIYSTLILKMDDTVHYLFEYHTIFVDFDRLRSRRRWHPPDGRPPNTDGSRYIVLLFY